MHRLNRSVKRRLCRQEGFTLFEIIMVLLILGVLSYFVATRLFSGDSPDQKARDGTRQESSEVCPIASHEYRASNGIHECVGHQVRLIYTVLALQGTERQYDCSFARCGIFRWGGCPQRGPAQLEQPRNRKSGFRLIRKSRQFHPVLHRSVQGGRQRRWAP